MPLDADALYAWFRVSGQSRRIQAGSYGFENTITPWQLLGKLTGSDVSVRTVTLVEGWTFRQMRQALAASEGLKPTTKSLSDAELMKLLGRPGLPPEGRFFRTPTATHAAHRIPRCCSALCAPWTSASKRPGRRVIGGLH